VQSLRVGNLIYPGASLERPIASDSPQMLRFVPQNALVTYRPTRSQVEKIFRGYTSDPRLKGRKKGGTDQERVGTGKERG
jgi:hypothetical protein